MNPSLATDFMASTIDPVCDWAEVKTIPGTHQQGLFSRKNYARGVMLGRFTAAARFLEPNRLTIQTGPQEHIHLLPEALSFTNHSCDPTIYFNMQLFEIEALQNIRIGDELTFFYPSTEWEMAEPFSCCCGSPRCLGKIQGARHLLPEKIPAYRLNDFIKHLL